MSTDTITTKFKFAPTLLRDDTQYEAEGGWYDGNRVRFRNNNPENIRGWNKRVLGQLTGTPRDIEIWSGLNQANYIAWGTNNALQIYEGGQVSDITPSTSTTSLSNQISTSVGSSSILVSLTGHTRASGDRVVFVSMAATVGGNVFLNSTFTITTASDSNHFTFTYTTVAAATSANVGTVTLQYLLKSGPQFNTGGLGWGAGTYGTGTYGTPASSSNIVLSMRNWSMDTFGEDLLANPRGGSIYLWDATSGTDVRAQFVSAAPVSVNSVIVSEKSRHVIALGCNDVSGAFDPMLIRWSDQENYDVWTPTVTNAAGDFRIQRGTQINQGVYSRGGVLILTDSALYGMVYVGQPYIFATDILGDGCGSISPHAAKDFNGSLYWMGDGNFFVFNGQVQVLPSSARKYVFSDFNYSQKEKVFCGINTEFSEITWLYPSADSDECDRYISYNPVNNYWVFGNSYWTTWNFGADIFGSIITTGVSAGNAYLYNNEPADTYSGVIGDNQLIGYESFNQSGDFDLGDGDDLLFADKFIPDFELSDPGGINNDPQVNIVMGTKQYPTATTVSKGPFVVSASTRFQNIRLRGRQANLKISTSAIGTSWRLGTFRLDLVPDGKR